MRGSCGSASGRRDEPWAQDRGSRALRDAGFRLTGTTPLLEARRTFSRRVRDRNPARSGFRGAVERAALRRSAHVERAFEASAEGEAYFADSAVYGERSSTTRASGVRSSRDGHGNVSHLGSANATSARPRRLSEGRPRRRGAELRAPTRAHAVEPTCVAYRPRPERRRLLTGGGEYLPERHPRPGASTRSRRPSPASHPARASARRGRRAALDAQEENVGCAGTRSNADHAEDVHADSSLRRGDSRPTGAGGFRRARGSGGAAETDLGSLRPIIAKPRAHVLPEQAGDGGCAREEFVIAAAEPWGSTGVLGGRRASLGRHVQRRWSSPRSLPVAPRAPGAPGPRRGGCGVGGASCAGERASPRGRTLRRAGRGAARRCVTRARTRRGPRSPDSGGRATWARARAIAQPRETGAVDCAHAATTGPWAGVAVPQPPGSRRARCEG